jgi:hypothetical protein
MAYVVRRTDGNVQLIVQDGLTDSSLGVTLVGRSYSNYGEAIANNFVKILENFASTTPPSNPLEGQIWYDKNESRLKLWKTTGWEAMSDRGITGYAGSRGATGSRGIEGLTGYTGSEGFGYTGSRGYTGSQGIQGEVGPTGYLGPIGPTGPIGPIGNDSTVPGPKGYTGSRGLPGPIGPSGYVGSKGIPGAQGPAGPAGGPTGPQGELGYTGSQGEIGYTGSQGELGYTGSAGAGYTGSQGEIGYTGSFGIIGYTGSRGNVGATGTVRDWALVENFIDIDFSSSPSQIKNMARSIEYYATIYKEIIIKFNVGSVFTALLPIGIIVSNDLFSLGTAPNANGTPHLVYWPDITKAQITIYNTNRSTTTGSLFIYAR